MFYNARCMNIIFNSLLAQHVKYDVHTTRKIKSIHAIFLSHYNCTVCGVILQKLPKYRFWFSFPNINSNPLNCYPWLCLRDICRWLLS